jgi:hypothetical protein
VKNDAEEQLNWEYGMIYREYGEDLPSRVAKTTCCLLSALPGFMRSYLTRIASGPMPVSEAMMRIAIAHSEINGRRDIIEELLEPILRMVVGSFQPYSNEEQSRV